MKSEFEPTRVSGFLMDYKAMLEDLTSGDFCKYNDGIGWAMSELGFHGWEHEDIKKERELYKAINQRVDALVEILKQAIGEDSK